MATLPTKIRQRAFCIFRSHAHEDHVGTSQHLFGRRGHHAVVIARQCAGDVGIARRKQSLTVVTSATKRRNKICGELSRSDYAESDHGWVRYLHGYGDAAAVLR